MVAAPIGSVCRLSYSMRIYSYRYYFPLVFHGKPKARTVVAKARTVAAASRTRGRQPRVLRVRIQVHKGSGCDGLLGAVGHVEYLNPLQVHENRASVIVAWLQPDMKSSWIPRNCTKAASVIVA